MRRLARLCIRNRRTVFALWAVVFVVGIAGAPLLFGRLSSDTGTVPGSESARAAELRDQIAPSGDVIYAITDDRAVADPGLRASIEMVSANLRRMPEVTKVVNAYLPGGTGLAARDGRASAIRVTFRPDRPETGEVTAATAELRTIDSPRVLVGGGPLQDDEMNAQAAADLKHAEILSMPVVLVLLLVLFGGFLAAGLPLLLALLGMAATLGALLGLSVLGDVSVYSVNIVTMLGLGLAVDYSLLLVSRFREERAAVEDVPLAVERMLATAGRTVLFSGLTVAVSLAGLLVFPDTFLRSMGFAGLSVVLLDLVAALTLLPALLSWMGGRIRPARLSGHGLGVFVRITRQVRRRPVAVLLIVGTGLVVAALPFASVRFADPDARSLPVASSSRQLQELGAARFDLGNQAGPITVITARVLDPSQQRDYVSALQRLDGVRTVAARPDAVGRTVLDVTPIGATQGAPAMRLVGEIRAAQEDVLVAGDAAELTDYQTALHDRIPYAIGIVVLATFILLFLFTGSVVVPAKAILLNLLSLCAGFGALVWVFQDGHLGRLVGTQALGSLGVTTPVLVFGIAFGLSMDYEVFLLGRITEVYRETGDNDLAVERGLQRTGGIVTAAALLVVVVFAGFVAGGFSPVKQVGLGLVLSVAVDATLVRMLLLPAVMTLLGRANWWAPAPLRRLHARIGLVEAATRRLESELPDGHPPVPLVVA